VSTFSGLNTAYRGLTAARQGLEVVGQNIANANTDGYTRQRVTTSSVPAAGLAGMFSAGVRAGEGVSVDGIARLGDLYLDARVRSSAATSGYWMSRAEAMTDLETTLREPGDSGLSAQLGEFWSAWQGVANRAGEVAPAAVLLEEAGALASRLATGYADVDSQWSRLRAQTAQSVADLNGAAARIADLNGVIRGTVAAGGSANELIDQRASLAAEIAALAGGTVRHRDDGMIDVTIGGNAIVSGDSARAVRTTGAARLDQAAGSPVTLEWADSPGREIALDGGRIAGTLSVLGAADAGGTGGALAELAASYDAVALSLATAVNTVHRSGVTTSGAAGGDFFAIAAGKSAAQGLIVIPTGAAQIASGTPGAGGFDGSIADAISQLRLAPGSADAIWAGVVVGTGVTTKSAAQQAVVAHFAASSAAGAQLSGASVDLDEENVSLMTFQTAYQGAARVMTAIDQMLDTLINRTGIVGR